MASCIEPQPVARLPEEPPPRPAVFQPDVPLRTLCGAAAAGTTGLSVLCYNVLLPNSVDGWWVYKYYDYDAPASVSAWPHRQQLLRDHILHADADVVCLQEVAPESFEADFAFMAEAGYAHELLNKGRMRNATFWRRDRVSLLAAFSKDRTLTTQLRMLHPPLPEHEQEPAGKETPFNCTDTTSTFMPQQHCDPPATLAADVFVVNCHLSAGPQADRRLRQMHEALDAIRKLALKDAKGRAIAANGSGNDQDSAATTPDGQGGRKSARKAAAAAPFADDPLGRLAIIVCGDFNSQGATAVLELLVVGSVTPGFRESGDPTERNQASTPVTSKTKSTPLGPFADAYADGFGGANAPSTLVCKSLDHQMIDLVTGAPTATFVGEVRQMFARLSSDGEVMTRADVERWLLAVNRAHSRGSEYRAAEAVLAAKAAAGKAPVLTPSDLLDIYKAEIDQGKYWGVEHDLGVVNGRGMFVAGSAPFEARFDYLYYTPATLACRAVRQPLTARQRQLLYEERVATLPNEWHPSDHLPLAAVFELHE